jgi:hypothetical protein
MTPAFELEERMTLAQQTDTGEWIQSMSNEQLSELMSKCQSLISQGSARIEDYEAFVLCQKELARRTWA